ncbi:MAG: tautomerase family protein [Actinomycetota bacterium]
MPFYHATIRPGLLPPTAREGFANDVVDVHCGVTGAPPSFVHVLVTEDTDGALPAGSNAVVAGTIRAGRTDDQKAEIAERLSAALAGRGGVQADTVSTTTRDVQASYTMEGGEVLPEPGSPEEERWKALGTAVQS